MAIGSRDQPMVLDSEEEGNGGDVSSYSYAPRKRVKVEKVKKEDKQSEGRDDVRDQLLKLDTEIDDVKAQLEPLQALLVSLKSERSELERRLHASAHSTSHPSSASFPSSSTSKSQAATMINYQQDAFPWSDQLKAMAKRTFGISKFRLCQEGVINAAMDGRDIVCVMPTGGGKSLTYQLPAIMGKGVTVVISPLLALIWDQCRALTEVGVKCVMLTGNVSQSDQSRIMRELEDGADDPSRDIRLCYVTPEKVSKSKRFIASLQKLYSAGRLKRFVIDEAHCCSQLGHDYRPDYKELAKLKSLFPRTPIQAVTATLSSKTLPDLRRILQLPECVNAERAPPPTARVGTVFFTAPLYRPNLHYKVINKPSSSKASIEAIVHWITANRPVQLINRGESGIIYCLSKKDTEEVADAVRLASKGAIKTGVYHAAIDDGEKERIHIQWRQGIVNCICATIAFGLGIDKGDVRYVIHHSLSKSLDGYYQETGRAGRDGQDSDCVLFFRPQDSTRLSALMTGVPSETEKLREMILYAQNVKTCRKVLFAKYFSTSAQLSATAWDNAADLTADGAGAGGNITTCGSCDNCIRDPEALQTRDVTVDAWKMLKVAHYVESNGGRLTAGGLVDLARGLGGGKFAVQQTNKKGRSFNAGEGKLDVVSLIGDKVSMSKDDAETLVLDLILGSYLREYYVQTAYSMNVYVQPADKAYRLTRLSRERIESGDALAAPIRCTFVVPVKAARKEKAKTPAKRAKTKVVEISDGDDGENDHAGVDGSEEEDAERDRRSGSSKSVGESGSSRKGVVKSEKTSSSKRSPVPTKVKARQPMVKKRKVAVKPLEVDDGDDNEFDRGVFDVDGVQGEDVEDYPVYGEEAGDAGVGGRGAESRGLGAFEDAWSDDEAY